MLSGMKECREMLAADTLNLIEAKPARQAATRVAAIPQPAPSRNRLRVHFNARPRIPVGAQRGNSASTELPNP
jgi:hypothetical protein